MIAILTEANGQTFLDGFFFYTENRKLIHLCMDALGFPSPSQYVIKHEDKLDYEQDGMESFYICMGCPVRLREVEINGAVDIDDEDGHVSMTDISFNIPISRSNYDAFEVINYLRT